MDSHAQRTLDSIRRHLEEQMKISKTHNWRDLIDPTWESRCCICGQPMSVLDFQREEAVAACDPRLGILAACHARHIKEDQPRASRIMAEHVAAFLEEHAR